MADGSDRGIRTSQALVSVAMLKVSLDQEGRDHIDQLNAFVKQALPKVGQLIDVNALAAIVLEKFGLRVPVAVIESALRRLAKQGVIRRDNYVYVVARGATGGDFDARRNQAAADISTVVSAFQRFSLQFFPAPITGAEAETVLISFVSKNSIECLRSYVFRTPFPKMSHDTQQSYVLARFINDAATQHAELFELIMVVFKGVMLANAFTCPDLESTTKKFAGITFYLDTPLVLSLLRLHGPNDYEKLSEIVFLLRNLKGSVAVFDHTMDEVDSVLAWCEDAMRRKWSSNNRVIQSLVASGGGPSDIVIMRALVKEKLEEVGVSVRATPEYIEHLQIDENALKGVLSEGVGYPRERAIHYDINSVRSIYALRDGSSPKRLEDARAIFVTSNSSFARSAFSYSRNLEITKHVSPVITDYSVANVAWLKSPTLAADLPKHELLAMCFAALEPAGSLWESFLSAAENLHRRGRITADELAVLRADGEARQDLMDLTVGADEEFQSENVQVVLDRMKKRLVAEQELTIDAKQNEIDEFRRERDVASAQRSSLSAEFQRRGDEIFQRAHKRAEQVLYALWTILVIATLALPFLTIRDGAYFLTAWVCLAAISLGPVLLKYMGHDLAKSIPCWWAGRRRSAWLRENVALEALCVSEGAVESPATGSG